MVLVVGDGVVVGVVVVIVVVVVVEVVVVVVVVGVADEPLYQKYGLYFCH